MLVSTLQSKTPVENLFIDFKIFSPLLPASGKTNGVFLAHFEQFDLLLIVQRSYFAWVSVLLHALVR